VSPGELHTGWADDQVWTHWVRFTQRDDRSSALAQPHIVGQDGPLPTEEKCHARALMGVETGVGIADLTRGMSERFG
jgi:hypothetical protein